MHTLIAIALATVIPAKPPPKYDVVVCGATPAGIAAANVDGRTTRREWLVFVHDAWIKSK